MEPISTGVVYKSVIAFDEKLEVDSEDVEALRQSLSDNPEALLDLDKPCLSRLKVKLLLKGTPKQDEVIQKIDGVISVKKTDFNKLFKKISELIKCYEILGRLKENKKLVIYSYRPTGEYEMLIESRKTNTHWVRIPFAAASIVSTFIAYQRLESPSDILPILQFIRFDALTAIYSLLEELAIPTISENDFNDSVDILVTLQSHIPYAIDSLKYLEVIEEENYALIELSKFLDKQIAILNRRAIYRSGLDLPFELVCDYSQGRLGDVRREIELINFDDETKGSLACAVICMKAVQSFFVKGLPESNEEIYKLIDQGVRQYKKQGYHGLVAFDDVFNHLSEREQAALQVVKLTAAEGIDELAAMAFEAVNEFSGQVSLYLDSTLEGLMKKVGVTGERLCAVLTTCSKKSTNATLVIMFDDKKRPYLFNSHGQTYKGKSLGASLLTFKDINSLNIYIKETFYKNEDGQFQLKLLQGV